MNSLKTLFIVAVLGAVAYGVYVSINRNPETPTAMDNAPAWPQAPQIQIPGPGTASTQLPTAPSGTDPAPSFVPPGTPAAPTGAATNGTPGTYPVGSVAGPPGEVASPGGPPAAVVPRASLGTEENLLRSDSTPDARTPASNPLPGRSAQDDIQEKLAAFMQAVQAKLDEGHLAEAHLALSSLYGSPDVPPEQARRVTELLDQLAGTVIYSRQHLLEPPYRVREGETLEQVAQTYNVPWQLLARINGIRDPRDLRPGQELKVVRGPFSALVELDRHEMTLILGGRYAGRFSIGVGSDHPRLEGSYVVRDKTVNPAYYPPDAPDRSVAAADPNNPLGGLWIDLGNRIGIHGTNDPQNVGRTGGRGSICLGERDIDDVFGILSIGSRVIIRR